MVHKNGEVQSFSERWVQVASERGVKTRIVNALSDRIMDRLVGCDAFMWRFGYLPMPRLFAKRLLMAIEHGMNLPVFPSWRTAWHFEDKIAQHYLMRASGLPEPRTWVFWRVEDAEAFCARAAYPLVMKISFGFQSRGVRLLRNQAEAGAAIKEMFGTHTGRREIQGGYFYVQEFLEGNEFDTRVTVIGSRAFAFRRFNRPDDFRASGSGLLDWDPAMIDEQTVRLAFAVARKLGTQSVAIDGLRRGEERVAGEISYTYASWAVRDCPGHWVLDGEPGSGTLTWVDGSMHPADAIFDDLVAQVQAGAAAKADSPLETLAAEPHAVSLPLAGGR